MTGAAAPQQVAVAAPHTAAVAAAADAARAGGNALDAALAAAVVLTVVYPHQCSLGGDLVAVVRRAGEMTAVLSVGAAPEALDPSRFGGARMPGQGADTVTVPGVLAGWRALAELGARHPLPSHLLRAADLADDCEVSSGLGRAIRSRLPQVRSDDGLRAVFTRDGEPLVVGEQLTQPDLAATLRGLAADPDGFYTGAVAEQLCRALGALGGCHRTSDFAAHEADVTQPLAATVAGHTWYAAPPPSQGVILLGVLADAVAEARGEEPTTALLDAFVEAADARAAFLADPRGRTVVLDALLRRGAAPASGTPAARPGRLLGDTVAVTTVDADGTVVVLIQSVYQSFGAGILDPVTGIVLHNRGSAFSTDPAHPAHVAPGRRPPHTLCPLIGVGERVTFGAGCQGGSAQPWILARVCARLATGERDLDALLAAPRWIIGAGDIGHPTTTVLAEPGCHEAVAAAAVRGLPVDQRTGPVDDAGHVQLVRAAPGVLEAASDPRADGAAAVITTTEPADPTRSEP